MWDQTLQKLAKRPIEVLLTYYYSHHKQRKLESSCLKGVRTRCVTFLMSRTCTSIGLCITDLINGIYQFNSLICMVYINLLVIVCLLLQVGSMPTCSSFECNWFSVWLCGYSDRQCGQTHWLSVEIEACGLGLRWGMCGNSSRNRKSKIFWCVILFIYLSQ